VPAQSHQGKFEAGDPWFCDTLAQIAEVAEQGRTAILNRDYDTHDRLIN
jgi:hypothetical protein